MDQIVALCKRRGFSYQASEIYGGIRRLLGLRPARRAPEKQHPRLVVAADGPDARRSDPTARPSRMVGLGFRDHPAIPKRGRRADTSPGFNDPMVDDRDPRAATAPTTCRCSSRKDGQGNSYAFVDDREAAEKKIKRDGRRKPIGLRRRHARRRCPLEAYAKIVGPDTRRRAR
jgi:hypothetical protein